MTEEPIFTPSRLEEVCSPDPARQEFIRSLSDEELLLELRRRGRVQRVEVKSDLPLFFGHASPHGMPPDDYLIRKAWASLADGLADKHIAQEVIPDGGRNPVSDVPCDRPLPGNPEEVRRVKFALNFVVEKQEPSHDRPA